MLTIDRTVTGTACSDFIGFIGSNFLGQAQIAADDLGPATGGSAKVAILSGTPGNNVAADRTSGFTAELAAKYPNMSVVASQTANFDQTDGQKVMEQMLQAHPGITAVYAENDGMALGAIQAITAAGKTPGKDIRIVSIDGIQQAVQDVAAAADGRRHRDQPAVRPAGLRLAPGLLRHDRRAAEGHHQGQPLHRADAQSALANGLVY